MREAGRLGAVLVQFPWSFRADDHAFRRLETIRGDFARLPLVVEVRHASCTSDLAVQRISR